MNETSEKNEIGGADIKSLILTIRGKQVLLDEDVARLYGYETKRVNETANRNRKRFPAQFRFRLTQNEVEEILRSQIVTSSADEDDHSGMRSQIATASNLRSQIATAYKRNERYLPYAFTEQGIGMLSGLFRW
jgi:hypothetical protein